MSGASPGRITGSRKWMPGRTFVDREDVSQNAGIGSRTGKHEAGRRPVRVTGIDERDEVTR